MAGILERPSVGQLPRAWVRAKCAANASHVSVGWERVCKRVLVLSFLTSRGEHVARLGRMYLLTIRTFSAYSWCLCELVSGSSCPAFFVCCDAAVPPPTSPTALPPCARSTTGMESHVDCVEGLSSSSHDGGSGKDTEDEEEPPRLSLADLRREDARRGRRRRPLGVVAADAARAHASYVRHRAAMTPNARDAARARRREKDRNKTREETEYDREHRKVAATAKRTTASEATRDTDAALAATRSELQRRRGESVHEVSEAELLNTEEADRLDAERAVRPLDAQLAENLYKECQRQLGWEGMGEAVCVVCLLLTPVSDTVQFPPPAWPLAAMAERLRAADDLPLALVAQYDLSGIFSETRGMLLSPLGVIGALCGDARGPATDSSSVDAQSTAGTALGIEGGGINAPSAAPERRATDSPRMEAAADGRAGEVPVGTASRCTGSTYSDTKAAGGTPGVPIGGTRGGTGSGTCGATCSGTCGGTRCDSNEPALIFCATCLGSL